MNKEVLKLLAHNRNANNKNETFVFSVGGHKFFCKKLDTLSFQKEKAGYKVIKRYYPVSELVYAGEDSSGGILIFSYEPSVGANRGLLVDLFVSERHVDKAFLPILNLYKKVFTNTLKKDFGSSVDIFFRDRVHTRLTDFYSKKFIEQFRGLKISLNKTEIMVDLPAILTSIKDFFKSQKLQWCIISQGDPNDLNIGTKPIIFDYAAGGHIPLMAEFAIMFWYCIAQGNYFSLKYNKKVFAEHKAVFAKIDKLLLRGKNLHHIPSPIRLEFLEAYIKAVITPCFVKVGIPKDWYKDFKNYLAMRILAVFNIAKMSKKDRLLSLAYLEYFYNRIDPQSPDELLATCFEIWKK